MRSVVLYIAMSLDGFIADQAGRVDWLGGDGSEPENPGSYPDFIKTVDTVIMGYTTYHQVVTELSPGQWVYADKNCYIMTHRQIPSEAGIIFTDQSPAELVARLKAQDGQAIWVCGGADIANQLLEADEIDTIWITVIPTLLGRGVRLFAEHADEKPLKLESVKTYNGMTDLVYSRRLM